METSGINLLNFMNSATSSVQTVLAKPSCFKRNTNHRRFLQKQLLQHHNDKDLTSLRLATTNAALKPKHRTIKKIKSLSTKRKPESWEQGGYEFSHQIRVPSPSMDYLQYTELDDASFYQEHSTIEASFHLDEHSCFEGNSQYQIGQYENNENIFQSYDLQNGIYKLEEELPPSLPPTSSLSFCSFIPKNCEESSLLENDIEYTEFLTGEELVMTLKESELFVPEIIYTEIPNINTQDYKSIFLCDGYYAYNPGSNICNNLSNVEDCCSYQEKSPILDGLLSASFEFW